MNLGRMPACNILPFDGDHTASVPTIESDNIKNELTVQVKVKGNRCGHNKNKIKVSPIYGAILSDRRIPYTISESGKRLEYLARRIRKGFRRRDTKIGKNIEDPTYSWYIPLFENERFLRLLYNPTKNKRRRRRRSEYIESAFFLALGTLVYRCELYKMAVGFFNSRNEFIFFDYARIAKESGLSMSRLKRAMRLLQEVGLVQVKTIKKTLDDGKIITVQTQIHLVDDIFLLLGLKDDFLRDREFKAVKFHNKERQIQAKQHKANYYRKSELPKKTKKPYHKPLSNNSKITTNGFNITAKTITPYKPQSAGDTADQLKLYKEYMRKGLTSQQAIEALKKSRPPPH